MLDVMGRKAVMCVGAFLVSSNLVAYAFAQTVQPPAGSERIKEQERMMVGAPMRMFYYKTSRDKNSVLQYYRSQLQKQGWKEFRPMDVLKELPLPESVDLKIDESMVTFADQNVMFSKGEEMVVLNFLPGEFTKDKKTYFTIAEGAPLSDEAQAKVAAGGDVYVPELLATPKEMPIAEYPSAKLISLQESPLLSTAVYHTQDAPQGVLDYYREKAQAEGWTLLEDVPMHEVSQGTLPEGVAGEDCPSCSHAQTLQAVAQSKMQMELGELVYTNSRKQQLRIGVSAVESNAQGLPSPLKFTTVVVVYGQEK